MRKSQELAIEQSELRERVNALLEKDGETLTDEERAELTKKSERLQAIEPELRAALTIEAKEDDEARARFSEDDPEHRELIRLAGRANVGNIFVSAIERRATEGAEAEIQQHFGIRSNQIPLAMLRRVEERAVTPAPTNVQATQHPIVQPVFAQSAAAFLGVDMPMVPAGDAVFPVLTSRPTVGGPHTDSTSVSETTGSFDAETLAPARLQASFFYRRTDAARFPGMDDALRMALADGLGEAVDKEVISGTNGLLSGTNLANHNVNAVTSYANYVSNFGFSRVDGRYAGMVSDIRVVLGSATYAHAGTVYRNNSVDRTALDRLMEVTGGVQVSAHVPAVAQNGIIRLGMRRDMVCPLWEGVTIIPDEVTKAATGEIVITAVLMHATKIIRTDGFYKQQTQHA